jgi:SRSO17 transposase
MNLEGTEDSASRFAAYVEELTSVIGHADRARPMNDYCAGLLITEGRRSVEPIADAARGPTLPSRFDESQSTDIL